MRFTHPYFLFLLFLIPLSWYMARNARIFFRATQFYTFTVMRSLVWLLLILALAGVEIAWGRFGNLSLLWVLDTSGSISPRQGRWFKDYMLRTSKALPSGAQVGLIACGQEAKSMLELSDPEQLGELLEKPLDNLPNPGFSNLAAGVEAALSSAHLGYTSRLVLLTDGNENLGELIKAAKVAGSQGVPIYPVLAPPREMQEILIEELTVPPGVQKGEAFEIKVRLNNLNLLNSKAVLKLFIDGKEKASQPLNLVPGLNIHKWVQRLDSAGPHFCRVLLLAIEDTNQENNQAMGAITVKGNPKLLCIEGKGGDTQFLAKVLKRNKIEVVVKKSTQFPKEIGELSPYAGLVFNNVPRSALNLEQMNMIKRYVADLGGGFLMLGGAKSFSSGGYHQTPLEEIMPVNMDQNVSYKFKQVLLMVLLDRSPSMEGKKLDLAKRAAKRVLQQLRDSDMMGIVLFDSQYEKVFNFQLIWGKREQMIEAIDNIKVGRGGTNIYPALEDAYNLLLNPPLRLRQMPLQIKHILLLTDGKTYRGEFEKLARQIARKKMTISTIAVGSEAEVDLLGDIARIGRGLFHHPTNLQKLPELFVADLKDAISKTPFVEKIFTPTVLAPNSPILTGIKLKEMPPLKGYMVTKPKAGAQVVLSSQVRGFNDPVLVHWRHGLGTTMAYTSDVVPRWSAKWIGWKSFSKFWVQAVRFMLRQDKSDWQVKVQHVPGGVMLTVDTGRDKTPEGELFAYLAMKDGEEMEIPLERIGLGKYRGRAKTHLSGKFGLNLREKRKGKLYHQHTRGIIIPPFLGEYRQFTPNQRLLRRVARLSGGIFNPQTSEPLLAPTEKTAQFNPLWQYLVGLALVLFVSEVGLRKWWL